MRLGRPHGFYLPGKTGWLRYYLDAATHTRPWAWAIPSGLRREICDSYDRWCDT